MPSWDDAASWYLRMLRESRTGFNELAADTAVALLGDVRERVVLDVGCGEGHVARRIARSGGRVIGVEPARELLAAADRAEREEPLGISYRAGSAEALPEVEDRSVDAVCAVLALHHVAHVEAAFDEARRVLRVGGELVVVVPHPWTDHPGALWMDGEDGETRRLIGDYTREGFWSSGVDSAGDVVSVHDIGWHHRTLASWLTTVASAGFALGEVREPLVTEPGLESGPWRGLPRFFAFRATAGIEKEAPR